MGGSAGKESTCNAGDLGSIPGLGRAPGKGNNYPRQYSGLENTMDWIVHGIAKSWTRLSAFHFQFQCYPGSFHKLQSLGPGKLTSTSPGHTARKRHSQNSSPMLSFSKAHVLSATWLFKEKTNERRMPYNGPCFSYYTGLCLLQHKCKLIFCYNGISNLVFQSALLKSC